MRGNLPWLDPLAALDRLGGDQALYLALLERFRERCRGWEPEFQDALRRPERAPAATLAHTLKGLAGNLGAVALHAWAAEMETCLRTGGDAAPVLARLQEVLDGTLHAATHLELPRG